MALLTTLPDAANTLAQLAHLIRDTHSDPTVVLLLCESPEAALARAFAQAHPIDSAAILRTWCSSARGLLSRSHSAPDKTLLIDADEAAGALDAARDAWKLIGGLAAEGAATALNLRPDSLARAAVAPLLSGQTSALALWAELQAGCRLLPAVAPPDPSSAATRLGQLLAEMDALRKAQEQSQNSLADALRKLDDATTNAAELEDEAQLARLLHQQALDELQEAATRCVLVEASQHEQAQLSQELEQLRMDLANAHADRRQAHAGWQSEISRLGVLEGELSALKTGTDSERLHWAQKQNELAAEVLDLKFRLERSNAELKEAASRNSALDERCCALAAQLDTAASAVEEQRRELSSSKAELLLLKASLATQLREAEAQIESLTKELSSERAHAHAYKQALELEQARAANAEDLLSTERSRSADVRTQAERTRLELAETSQQIARHEANASESTLREAALTRDRDQLRDELARIGEEIVVLTHRADSASTREALLEAQLTDALAGLQECTKADVEVTKLAKWPLRGACHISLVGERNTEPHRELTLRVEIDSRFPAANPAFEVRLVEHEGRAGLIFFKDQDHSPPLHIWSSDGVEAEREFVRVIPADSDAAAAIAHLPPNDWRLIQGLTHLLARQPEAAGLDLSRHWVIVARRLALELDALPNRLRYSTLHAALAADTVLVNLKDVLFGSERLPDIELKWTGGTQPTVGWTLDSSGIPPLSSWSRKANGDYEGVMYLAVGDCDDKYSDKKRWWVSMPERERALLLALLETLISATRQLPITRGGEGSWVKDAVSLNREARGLAGAVDWRDRIRRVRRSLKL